ncbi:MAG: DHH family phosphoesterase [Clostridia bacterium]|nr:DHH family phosphoesterase [Clostridia bacterium]
MSDNSNEKAARSAPVLAIVCALLGVLSLGAVVIMISYMNIAPTSAALYGLGAYLAIVVIIGIIAVIKRAVSGGNFAEMRSSTFGNISIEFIQKLQMPVIVCDEKGKIVWYNTALSSKFHTRGMVYGKYIDNICDATIERIVKDEGDAEITFSAASEVGADSTVYRAKGYEVTSRGKKYYMTIFVDYTETKSLYSRIDAEETIIAYVVIDNLDELMQYVQRLYSEASSDVERILRRHIESVGGVVRDYSNNKFLCVFEARNLEAFTQDKFSILDDVREIQVGDSSVPITVSMGIAKINGSLLDKEQVAQEALDLALQRGGDQVVIKSADGVEFYGGKTKTVQKRTKVRSRVIANEFKTLIEKSSNVIVMGHRYADFDALASCLAVARIATTLGVKVNIVSDINDRNLASCFERLNQYPEYRSIFVDKIEAQDLIQSGTIAVVVDVNNLAFCEAPDVVNNAANLIIIDHHRKTAEYKVRPNIAYIEPSASSASELLSEFLEQLIPSGTLPKVEADILFAGMLLDTKKFTHNTGVRTFSSALYLRGEGASPLDAEALFRTDIKDFLTEAKFESNVVIYKSVIAIALNDGENNSPLVRVSAAKAADRLLSVEGVQAAFALCKIDETVHISARSQGTINVQLILEKMGGGGHFDSAGVQVKNSSTSTALTTLRAAIDEYLAENM